MTDQISGNFRHLLSIDELTPSLIRQILQRANDISMIKDHLLAEDNSLNGKTIANLFFEPSTRTRCSFEIAAKRLGVDVLNFDVDRSSLQKGEELLDTIHALEAMGVNGFIVRHFEEDIPAIIAKNLKADSFVINAGDGQHAHPTQALLDMLTIYQLKKDFSNLKVAIVGDVCHSRVAHSDIEAMKLLGVKEIRLIGDTDFLPKEIDSETKHFTNVEIGLKDVDVIIVLRIQKERLDNGTMPDVKEYFQNYGLDEKRLKLAHPKAILMHPSPINRGIEIDSIVTDSPQSVILKQVTNGVCVRMAVMEMCLRSLVI